VTAHGVCVAPMALGFICGFGSQPLRAGLGYAAPTALVRGDRNDGGSFWICCSEGREHVGAAFECEERFLAVLGMTVDKDCVRCVSRLRRWVRGACLRQASSDDAAIFGVFLIIGTGELG
jgi:hypothetical protein